MTLELKTNYVLITDLQIIYKHKHIFNNTQCKIHNRHICHNTGHIIMHMIQCREYYAVLNKQYTVASVITVLTSMDCVQSTYTLYLYSTKLTKN